MSCCHYTGDIDVDGDSRKTGRVVSGTANNTANISINAKADQISQEGIEIFEIPLSVTSDELAVPVFVEGPAMITVNDKSGENVTHAQCYINTHLQIYSHCELYCAKVLILFRATSILHGSIKIIVLYNMYMYLDF